MPGSDIKFEKVKGKLHAEMNVLGLIYRPNAEVAGRFSDTVKLDFEDKKVLFSLRGAHADTACCGPGGMGFLSVAGILVAYKAEKNPDGVPVSEVKHVTDREARKRIQALLKQKFPYIDVVEFD